MLTISIDSLCTSSRGGVYNKTKSTTWQRLGFFELGADKELGNTAYAEYGLDSITLGSTGVTLPSAIVGSVNDTGYTWLGYFGLGTVPGSFDGKAPLSALSALVEKQGAVTSHSYGYTAGAKYRELAYFLSRELLPRFARLALTSFRSERSPDVSDTRWLRRATLRTSLDKLPA